MAPCRVLLLLAVLPFAACSCEEDPLAPKLPGTCEPDFPCGSAFEYRLGACRATRCALDTDCCPGQTCNAALGLCISQYENAACTDDSQCEVPGQSCIDFRGGRYCGYANATNTLSAAGTQRCDSDRECADGKSCFAHRCLNAAPCDGGCPEGSICELDSNTCYEAPACAAVCGPGQIKVVADSDTMSAAQCCAIDCACATLPGIPEGTYGWYAASALKTDALLVSSYDPNYGDLVVATFGLDGTKKAIAYVDGYPTTGPVIGNPDGLRAGRVEAGADVGLHTSIAVDSTGVAHVAYYDRDLGALKYANDSGGLWKSVVVDDSGDTGYYTSIALGADGTPRIAYMMTSGTLSPDPTSVTALKVATARSNLPLMASDWSTQVVDSAPKPALVCGGGCGRDEACVDLGMGPACVATTTGCAMCASGDACVADAMMMPVCEARIPTIPVDDLVDGTGLFASLAVATDGTLAIAYYDRLAGDLRYAVSDVSGTTWTLRTLDGNDTMTPTDVGQHVSLAFGPNGARGVAYVDATRDDLVYLDLVSMTREVVDDGVTPPNLRLVGADASLVFDDAGAPAIAYQDPTNIDLLYARRLGAPPMWSLEVLRGGPPAGSMRGSASGFYVDQSKAGTSALVTSVDVDFTEDGDVVLDVIVTPKRLD